MGRKPGRLLPEVRPCVPSTEDSLWHTALPCNTVAECMKKGRIRGWHPCQMLLKDALREAKWEPVGFSSTGNGKGGDFQELGQGSAKDKAGALPCRWESGCPLTVSVATIPQ